MIRLDGGSYLRGSDAFYPEEGPVSRVTVAPFSIDRAPVTNAQFAEFVAQTDYVTVAERELDPADFPGATLESLEPGSLVFVPTDGPVDLRDWRQWWAFVPGANWRHPRGPGSSIDGLESHPVVQIAYDDAEAYARWAGKRLPTELEWEFAARGGFDGASYAWGEEPNTPGARFANTWQGHFPYRNDGAQGWVYTSPVGTFAPNGYGLVDMTGNTWEWTSTEWTPRHVPQAEDSGCGCGCGPSGESPRAATMKLPMAGRGSRVTKGGSHLCSPEYCLRYRPAARSAQTEDSSTTHLGFRCAI